MTRGFHSMWDVGLGDRRLCMLLAAPASSELSVTAGVHALAEDPKRHPRAEEELNLTREHWLPVFQLIILFL